MRKKLLSLLFSSLLILQNSIAFSVKVCEGCKGGGPSSSTFSSHDRFDTIPKFKSSNQVSTDIITKTNRSHSSDERKITNNDQEHNFFCFVSGKNQIQRFIGNDLVYVYYMNSNASRDTLWIIFRAPSGRYICYQSNTALKDNRYDIIKDVESGKNSFSVRPEILLAHAKNIVLSIDDSFIYTHPHIFFPRVLKMK